MDESDHVGDQLSHNPPARTFRGSAGTRREGEPATNESHRVGDQLSHNPPARTFLGRGFSSLRSPLVVGAFGALLPKKISKNSANPADGGR
ncbi:MAG: hypothetical protein R6X02_32305 [Enhygromyxa sp.]